MRTTLLGLSTALLIAGCNTSTPGAEGKINFMPDNCGQFLAGCDFADSIGVGGVIDVHINGIDNYPTAGVNLISDNPAYLTVEVAPNSGNQPTWAATGVSPGVGRILAVDANGYEIDFIEVGVQNLTGLGMMNVLGDAVGPTLDDPKYDEVWTVNANQAVSLGIVPMIGNGVPTMGRYVYATTLDQGLTAALQQGYNLEEGYIYFNAPAGDYTANFDNGMGLTLSILIRAQ